MYTQCPSCETVYRITIDQLRRAEGEVRCGRCHALFNAVLRLTDYLPESALTDLGTGVYPSPNARPEAGPIATDAAQPAASSPESTAAAPPTTESRPIPEPAPVEEGPEEAQAAVAVQVRAPTPRHPIADRVPAAAALAWQAIPAMRGPAPRRPRRVRRPAPPRIPRHPVADRVPAAAAGAWRAIPEMRGPAPRRPRPAPAPARPRVPRHPVAERVPAAAAVARLAIPAMRGPAPRRPRPEVTRAEAAPTRLPRDEVAEMLMPVAAPGAWFATEPMRRPPPRPQPAPPAKRPPDEDFDPEATATGIHIIVSAATLVPAAAAAAWTAPLAMRGPAPPGRTPGHREPAAGESAPAGPAPETPVEALEGETVLASMAAATPGSVEEIVLSTEPASATAGALSAPASAAPDAPRRPPRFDEVEDDAELPEEFLPAPRRLPKTWLRLALVAVAVLALLISTIHSRRGELMRDPGTASWLGKLYGAFGSPARPTWEPRLLIIEDSAAEADRAGRLSVTTIFRNGAEFPQPFPILRVTLTDRWDQTLSRQDFAPIEYLQPGTPGDMIGAGQQVEANVLMLSTQSEAVGFNLDLCLDPGDGELRCALDDG